MKVIGMFSVSGVEHPVKAVFPNQRVMLDSIHMSWAKVPHMIRLETKGVNTSDEHTLVEVSHRIGEGENVEPGNIIAEFHAYDVEMYPDPSHL